MRSGCGHAVVTVLSSLLLLCRLRLANARSEGATCSSACDLSIARHRPDGSGLGVHGTGDRIEVRQRPVPREPQ